MDGLFLVIYGVLVVFCLNFILAVHYFQKWMILNIWLLLKEFVVLYQNQ